MSAESASGRRPHVRRASFSACSRQRRLTPRCRLRQADRRRAAVPASAAPARRFHRPAPAPGSAWALVPLMPNEDTPARRGRSPSRPGPGLGEQPDRRPRTSPRAAVGSSTCRVCGSTPCRMRHHHLDHARRPRPRPGCGRCWTSASPSHSGRSPGGPGRRWRAAPGPRSGRRARCRCRAPPPRRRRRRAGPRRPAPAG